LFFGSRESAVAQLSTLGGRHARRFYESHTQEKLEGFSSFVFICRCLLWRSSNFFREVIEAKHGSFILHFGHALFSWERIIL
jgi:hypothetical protein